MVFKLQLKAFCDSMNLHYHKMQRVKINRYIILSLQQRQGYGTGTQPEPRLWVTLTCHCWLHSVCAISWYSALQQENLVYTCCIFWVENEEQDFALQQQQQNKPSLEQMQEDSGGSLLGQQSGSKSLQQLLPGLAQSYLEPWRCLASCSCQ